MKDIPGFEGLYAVTKDGVVWSLPKKLNFNHGIRLTKLKKLKISKTKAGYLHVSLWHKWKCTHILVHRAVALTFIPNINNLPEINHKDGNKNNNSKFNLEWVTHKDNIRHAFKMGLYNRKKPNIE